MSANHTAPAFPVPAWAEDNGTLRYNAAGMTLRDYFAAKAMGGICTIPELETFDAVAKEAYAYADAMLRAREAA